MHRIMAMGATLTLTLTLVGVAGLTAADEPNDPTGLFRQPGVADPAPPRARSGFIYLPTEGYEPRPGDEAVLFAPNGMPVIAKYRVDLIQLIDVLSKNETGKLQKMAIDDQVKLASNGTRAKVHQVVDLDHRGEPYQACSLKILDGPYAGQTACTLADYVVRLEEVELTPTEKILMEWREDAIRKVKKGIEERPNTLLRMGQNLEKAGKVKAALENYREVLKVAPKSPAADKAAARIKVLDPKPAAK